ANVTENLSLPFRAEQSIEEWQRSGPANSGPLTGRSRCSTLWLRLHAGVGLFAVLLAVLAARAGLGHRRTARGGSVVAKISRGLFSSHDLADLVARKRLIFEHPFGDGDPFLLLLGQDRARGRIGLINQAAHFIIDD